MLVHQRLAGLLAAHAIAVGILFEAIDQHQARTRLEAAHHHEVDAQPAADVDQHAVIRQQLQNSADLENVFELVLIQNRGCRRVRKSSRHIFYGSFNQSLL